MNRLPGDLAAAMSEKDGRTIEELIDSDPVSEFVVERAVRHDDSTEVSFDGGWTTMLRGPEVKVGDTLGIYGPMFGVRHGWSLNGAIVEWQTPLERIAERVERIAHYDREQRERYAAEKESLDAKFAALPEAFQRRIARRRENNQAFRIEFESYEMFVCTQAVAFAEQAKETGGADPVGWLKWWASLNSKEHDYDIKRQRSEMPAMDGGHSGNTFDAAVHLAAIYITSPHDVDKMYGALAPLAGSEDYGDVDSVIA